MNREVKHLKILEAVIMDNKEFVTYEDFGAVGDGIADDFAAIKKAHDYANQAGLPVKAREGAHYYIHYNEIDGTVTSAIIKTNVIWSGARFTIDDRDISPVKADDTSKYAFEPIFKVVSDYPTLTIDDKAMLEKIESQLIAPGTKKIDLGLGFAAMIIPYSRRIEEKIYRRRGYGGFMGSERHEVIVIDSEGNVSEETPIMYEYPHISYIKVFRDSVAPITIDGGEFTTRASRVNVLRDIGGGKTNECGGYIYRGLEVTRSHTHIKNVKHYVTDEVTLKEQIKDGEYVHISSTYRGFYISQNANDILFENCVMTGRRCYGRPKHCITGGTGGTYDLSGNCVNKIVFKSCIQSNFWVKYDENYNITPAKESEPGAVASLMLQHIEGLNVKPIWGVGGTNFCKNMQYIDSTLSRFDAHAGLYNGKIINSSINAMALTGVGEMIVENVKWFAADPIYVFNSTFHFREDYGSTWQGSLNVKNLKAYYYDNKNASIFYHRYNNWYYGYDCYVPDIEIDGFEAFYQDTHEPLPDGYKIKLLGKSVVKEPALHLPETANSEAIYPYVDYDGDGLVDGTDVKYDAEWTKNNNTYRSGITTGSHKNLNVINPPKKIKLTNVRPGLVISVPDTSSFAGCDGGFFGKTKFYYTESDYYLGTNHKDTETFRFDDPEEFADV